MQVRYQAALRPEGFEVYPKLKKSKSTHQNTKNTVFKQTAFSLVPYLLVDQTHGDSVCLTGGSSPRDALQ